MMVLHLTHPHPIPRLLVKTCIICILSFVVITAKAQCPTPPVAAMKFSPGMRSLHIQHDTTPIPTAISCDDSRVLAAQLQEAGYRVTIISPTLITTSAPLSYIKSLSHQSNVSYIDAGRRASPSVELARELTNTNAIHQGIGLDTPYTGRGVLIGFIDCSIEYTHRLFKDDMGNSRVLCVWDHTGYSDSIFNEPTTTIPYDGDTIIWSGHGTHVAGICAGSRIPGTNIWGIAPDASLVFVSSEYYLSEIVEEVKFISDFANERNMPWVINASFGLACGPHDGLDYYSRTVDSLVSEGYGHQLVCAAGNRYNKRQHSSYTFDAAQDTVQLLTIPGTEGTSIDIWCQTADSLPHIGYRPYTVINGQCEYMDSTSLSLYCFEQTAPFNNKHNIYISIPRDSLGQAPQLGVELWSDIPTTIHCWTGENSGTITHPDSGYMDIDPTCTLDDMFATCPNVIAVGAYVSSDEYTDINGNLKKVNNGSIGAPCLFSSRGPSVNGTLQPIVTAPGSLLESGLSSVSDPQVGRRNTTTRVVNDHGTNYYFGVKQGTSMSTPVVSGIVALWLEANPFLPPSAIADIIKTTAVKDTYTGGDGWDPATGYGKIDAYSGLKMVLARAERDGVPTIRNTRPMMTISRRDCQIVILSGNSESHMEVSVILPDGHLAYRRQFTQIGKGSEVSIPLDTLPKGIYLLHITTQGGQVTRKITI